MSQSLADKRGVDYAGFLSAAPAALVVGICCVLPLLWMAGTLVANPGVRGELNPTAFRTALFGRTLGYNAGAAVIATLLGLPAAFVLGRGRGIIAKALWVVVPSALLLPSLSYAYGWSQFVRIVIMWVETHHPPIGARFWDKSVESVVPLLGPTRPLDVLRCIWSLGTWLWAVPATLIGLSLRRMDTGVQQQAALDGGLLRVTFRQLAGPIIASLAIVTILATQEFAIYDATGISVVATEIRMVFDTGAVSSVNFMPGTGTIAKGQPAPDQSERAAAAVATAIPVIGVTLCLALLAAWGAGRSGVSDTVEIGDWPRMLDTSRWTIALTILLLLVNIGLPVAALFASLRSRLSFAPIWDEFSPQVQGSLILAGITGCVAVLIALSGAVRWTPGLLAAAVATFLVGGQLLAIALIRIYNRPWLVWAYDSCIVTVAAYIGRFGWLAAASARTTWTRPWRDLRDMTSLDGAARLTAAVRVIWPLAWPTLLAGGLIVGALSLTEVPATVLLDPQNPPVLTNTLMTWLHMVHYDAMIQAALLMMATVLVPAVAAVLLIALGSRIVRRDLYK